MLAAVIAAALATASPQAAASDSLLRVFVDCPNYVPGCELDFLRTEITWVDYVRDREAADIHALGTALNTGGGGWQYTFALIGRGRWAGRVDTLQFTTAGTATYDEQRRAVVRHLGLALARYALTTSAAPRLTLTYQAPGTTGRAPARTSDPWNFWVFQMSYNINGNGSSYSSWQNQSGNISVNRTTDAWKVSVSGNYGESRSKFVNRYLLRDDTGAVVRDSAGNPVIAEDTYRSSSERYSANASVVRSLSTHWSARLRGSFGRRSQERIRRMFYAGPAIEYNFYPYSQSTRRSLTLQAGIVGAYFAYDTITIYDKRHETRPIAHGSLALSIVQPWGSMFASAGRAQFLDNRKHNSAEVFGELDVRLFRGFSVNFWGGREFVHDQIYLPKAPPSADPDELLLQQHTRETDYFFFFGLGVRYRFGSTNNNTVNPRFDRGGGVVSFN